MDPTQTPQPSTTSQSVPAAPLPAQPAPPVAAQPAPTPAAQAPAAIKQSQVGILQGKTYLSKTAPGMLEWSADNRIRLYQQPGPTVVFDCAPQEIQKFSIDRGYGAVKLANGSTVRLQFTAGSIAKTNIATLAGNFGLIGMIASTVLDKKASESEQSSDIYWWKENLARFGAKGFSMSSSTLFKIDKLGWIIGGVILLVGLIIAVVSLL